MKQFEQVIKTMEENGGYSTLGNLYQKIDVCEWKTKTPFASIRRIVQDEKYFFKIKPGLWALNTHKKEILDEFSISNKQTKIQLNEFDHSYYQGLLVEIGNLEGFKTIVPSQDKNKLFLSKPLKEYTTIEKFYDFTYDEIIRKVNTVDVCWFNERKYPNTMFEVEHSTDIYTSLLKFTLLQDFSIKFKIVAPAARKREFDSKVAHTSFVSIINKVDFIDYEKLSNYHSKLSMLNALKSGFYK